MKGNAENKSALCSFLMLNKSAINQVFASASKLHSLRVNMCTSPALLPYCIMSQRLSHCTDGDG